MSVIWLLKVTFSWHSASAECMECIHIILRTPVLMYDGLIFRLLCNSTKQCRIYLMHS